MRMQKFHGPRRKADPLRRGLAFRLAAYDLEQAVRQGPTCSFPVDPGTAGEQAVQLAALEQPLLGWIRQALLQGVNQNFRGLVHGP